MTRSPRTRHGLLVNRLLGAPTVGRRLVAEGRLEQAIAFFERLVADFPNAPEYHTELAYCQILAEHGPHP